MHKLYDVHAMGWLSGNWRTCLELLPLDDSRWATYRGGYNRAPYDVVPLIRRLHREGTSDGFWSSFGMSSIIKATSAKPPTRWFHMWSSINPANVSWMSRYFTTAWLLIWRGLRTRIRQYPAS